MIKHQDILFALKKVGTSVPAFLYFSDIVKTHSLIYE